MPQPKNLRLPLSYAKLVGSKMLSPPDGLQFGGPTVMVQIGLHAHLANKRQQHGDPIPPPVTGNAMIDSGATVTTIDSSVAQTLGLQPSGKVESVGIGGRSTGFTVACSVDIRGLVVNIARAHCHDLTKYSKKLICLIGRDILRHMVFHYDGPAGTVYLELPILQGSVPSKPKKARKRKDRARAKRRRRK
jgi:hypothetical protein